MKTTKLTSAPKSAAAPRERFLKATPRACAAARRNLDRVLASGDARAISAILRTLALVAERLQAKEA